MSSVCRELRGIKNEIEWIIKPGARMQNQIEMNDAVRSRQLALIEINIRWLRQALTLISKLDDTAYSTAPGELVPHRTGARRDRKQDGLADCHPSSAHHLRADP
jgi:hypothetical protein